MGKRLLSTSHTMRFSTAKHIQPFRVWETGPVHSSLRSGTLWAQTVGLYLSRRVLQPTGANVWTLQNCCRLITHTLGWLTVALLELKSPLRKCSFSIRIRACMHAHTMSVFLSLSLCLPVCLSLSSSFSYPPPHTHDGNSFECVRIYLFLNGFSAWARKCTHQDTPHPTPSSQTLKASQDAKSTSGCFLYYRLEWADFSYVQSPACNNCSRLVRVFSPKETTMWTSRRWPCGILQ